MNLVGSNWVRHPLRTDRPSRRLIRKQLKFHLVGIVGGASHIKKAKRQKLIQAARIGLDASEPAIQSEGGSRGSGRLPSTFSTLLHFGLLAVLSSRVHGFQRSVHSDTAERLPRQPSGEECWTREPKTKTTSKSPKTTRRIVFFPVLIDAFPRRMVPIQLLVRKSSSRPLVGPQSVAATYPADCSSSES